MKLITVKCPNCGAQLKIEEGRVFAVCENCANQIIIDPERDRNSAHGAETMEGLQRNGGVNAAVQAAPIPAAQGYTSPQGNAAAQVPPGQAVPPGQVIPPGSMPAGGQDIYARNRAAQPFDSERARSAARRVRQRAERYGQAPVPPPYETRTRFQSSDGIGSYSVQDAREPNQLLQNGRRRRRRAPVFFVFLLTAAIIAAAMGIMGSINSRARQIYEPPQVEYDWDEEPVPPDEEIWQGEDWAYAEEEQYLYGLSDISEEQSARLTRNSRSELNKYFMEQERWDLLNREVGEITPAGRYLLTSKDEDNFYRNKLYDIYQVTFPANANESGEVIGKDETLYFTVVYNNLEMKEDGSLLLSESYSRVEGDSVWLGRTQSGNDGLLDGYYDEEAMFNTVINRNMDNYYYEISEEMTDYFLEGDGT